MGTAEQLADTAEQLKTTVAMYEQKLVDMEEKLNQEKLKKTNEVSASGGPAFLRREVTTLKQQVRILRIFLSQLTTKKMIKILSSNKI